ncbi:hypothetical protein SERLA73DRAFT_72795 [Serpula lacrymans var. lacrymans S7.3]|uniref:DUF3533 domain-containing protein n=2 Tax=Serpula lacrymans var. lacrymans TaxID=341189 RepID=F8PUL2_SERL3|nr:uncharacterized protein SERLADRAFT_437343 [Serpula lacrymans var. lacrymans S7.9]EGO00047.1 hypothetical protein SERLA73DRAFT_72795 [Serpula lacrymans var. lacrymans S7.3]EGO25614.1 hypothetical protein SERLADRAFT_437343 [Serpula lacrymans var. lacrymans S7.9]
MPAPAPEEPTTDDSTTDSERTAAQKSEGSSWPTATPEQPPRHILDDEPFSHSFFDSDEGTSRARAQWFKILMFGLGVVICLVWTVLPMYWAALGRIDSHVGSLTGWVVDFDGGQIGQAVVLAFQNISGSDQMSWVTVPANQFPNGPPDLVSAILDERCWAAISINPSASANLNAAVAAKNGAYNGSLAVTAFASEARNENAYRDVIIEMINPPLQLASQQFALQYAAGLGNRSDIAALLMSAPSVVTLPFYYTLNNIRPFDVPVAAAVDYVGLIYLLILAFIMTNQLLAARVESGLARRLKLRSLILVRIFTPITMYFFVSLMYSLLSLAFEVPFNRRFGRAGFVIYWMMSWCAMIALGLALEALISNVAVVFYPISLLPGIFRYGYAMPFYNVSRTARTIIFSTQNQIGLNFGVQFAWILVSCMTLPLFTWFVRRQELRAWHKGRMHAKAVG